MVVAGYITQREAGVKMVIPSQPSFDVWGYGVLLFSLLGGEGLLPSGCNQLVALEWLCNLATNQTCEPVKHLVQSLALR